MGDVPEVADPFWDEARRHGHVSEAEEVLHLSGEDGEGDAAGESHHDGVGDEFEHSPHPAQAHSDEHHSRHNRGNCEALYSVLGDDARDYDDKCPRRTPYQEARTAEDGDEETCDDGGDETLLRRHSAGYTERYCEGQGYDADDNACREVGDETLTTVPPLLEEVEKLWTEYHIYNTLLSCVPSVRQAAWLARTSFRVSGRRANGPQR